ncbi:hypothetical protein C8Q75DRAFT_791641 [Abortiporus biennis]|nr:hypothetical protein C8Q75DRAFT_791641 [Abortiporus biennis]
MAFTLLQLSAALLAFFYSPVLVNAESHTVRFNNKCGHGTPMLIRGPDVLSKGPDYTSNGPLSSAIACNCGFNGENCAIVEFTLNNPTCAGCGSSTDISLISPHGFNVETGFSYFGGCDGSGATCNSGSCSSAFFKPDDNQVQVACQDNNVRQHSVLCSYLRIIILQIQKR